MTVEATPAERLRTRPWITAAALAASFIALEGLTNNVVGAASFPGEGFGPDSMLWEVLRTEWVIYLTYVAIGLVGALVLRLAVRSGSAEPWQRLVLKTVIVFVPVSMVVNLVIQLVYSFTHDHALVYFFGFWVIG